jgi:hypothetical protein
MRQFFTSTSGRLWAVSRWTRIETPIDCYYQDCGLIRAVFLVKTRHGNPSTSKVFREHNTIGRQLGVEHREVDPLKDMRRVGCLEEHGMGGVTRPAGHVLRSEVGSV